MFMPVIHPQAPGPGDELDHGAAGEIAKALRSGLQGTGGESTDTHDDCDPDPLSGDQITAAETERLTACVNEENIIDEAVDSADGEASSAFDVINQMDRGGTPAEGPGG